MKKLVVAGLIASIALLGAAPSAQAGNKAGAVLAGVAVGIGAALILDALTPPPVVAAPVVVYPPAPVVYTPPPVVYQPPPVVYQPAPVVYHAPPVIVTPRPVVYRPAPGIVHAPRHVIHGSHPGYHGRGRYSRDDAHGRRHWRAKHHQHDDD